MAGGSGPRRLPEVLTQKEVNKLLKCMDGISYLMSGFLYGSGLRLMECVRLRVKDLEECRVMLKDALHEMLLAYKDIGKEIPLGNALIEQLPVEVEYISQTA